MPSAPPCSGAKQRCERGEERGREGGEERERGGSHSHRSLRVGAVDLQLAVRTTDAPPASHTPPNRGAQSGPNTPPAPPRETLPQPTVRKVGGLELIIRLEEAKKKKKEKQEKKKKSWCFGG